jgi:hypothetical protein
MRGSGILEPSSTCRQRPTGLTVAAPPEQAGTVNRSRWLPIAGLGLALLMVTLDMTIVAVALPVIGRDLQASPQQASG